MTTLSAVTSPGGPAPDGKTSLRPPPPPNRCEVHRRCRTPPRWPSSGAFTHALVAFVGTGTHLGSQRARRQPSPRRTRARRMPFTTEERTPARRRGRNAAPRRATLVEPARTPAPYKPAAPRRRRSTSPPHAGAVAEKSPHTSMPNSDAICGAEHTRRGRPLPAVELLSACFGRASWARIGGPAEYCDERSPGGSYSPRHGRTCGYFGGSTKRRGSRRSGVRGTG